MKMKGGMYTMLLAAYIVSSLDPDGRLRRQLTQEAEKNKNLKNRDYGKNNKRS